MILGRDALLSKGCKVLHVAAPEFDGEILVAAMSLPLRLAAEKWIESRADADNLIGTVLFSVVDESGKRLLSEDDEDYIREHWPATLLLRVSKAAAELNNIDGEVTRAKGES